MLSSYIGRRPISARSAYLWWEGSWSLLQTIAFTLTLLYQVQVAHLNPAELLLVGAALEASCFLFEVPTSIVADVYSRRLSALIGAVIVGIGILIQGVFPSFIAILVAQVVWGLGFTFISGAVDAWITDEVGADDVQPLFTRCQQQHLALTFVGIVVAGLLAHLDLRLPMLVAGAGYLVLALVMAPLMPETGFTRTPGEEHGSWVQMKAAFTTGLRAARRPGLVRSFAIIAVLTGMASEVVDRLWTSRVVHDLGLPNAGGLKDASTWFTIFALISSLISLATSLAANRFAANRINDLHPRALLAGVVLIQAAGIIVFGILGSVWLALIALWVRDAARNLAYPVQSAWLSRNVESSARATTISMTSQADALGQVLGGPALGAVATRTTTPTALTISGLLLVPVAALFWRVPREHQDDHPVSK